MSLAGIFNRFKDQNARQDSLYQYIPVSSLVGAPLKFHLPDEQCYVAVCTVNCYKAKRVVSKISEKVDGTQGLQYRYRRYWNQFADTDSGSWYRRYDNTEKR